MWVKSVEDDNCALINENKNLIDQNTNLVNELRNIIHTIKEPILELDVTPPASEAVIIESSLAATNRKPLVLNDIVIEVDSKSLMVNATQMCKAAGKLFGHYKSLESTKDYLQALESNIGIPIIELVKTNAGNGGGTFVHRLVAVHLAQWLSPSFAVQVSMWVNEIIITGKVEMGNEMSNEAVDEKWRKKIEKTKIKYKKEVNMRKELEIIISTNEDEKKTSEINMKNRAIEEFNTTISVLSNETKANLPFYYEGREVIYLAYIGNYLFKYGQSSNCRERFGNHEKSFDTFIIVKVFMCSNPVVSEKGVREWVRKNKLEYEYKPEGEKNQREIIKIESKEMLEKVTKVMRKNSKKINENEIADVNMNNYNPSLVIELKKMEIHKELILKDKITYDQYKELSKV